MKHILAIGALFIIVGGIFLFISKSAEKEPGSLIANELLVTIFTGGGEPTRKALVQVPFLSSYEGSGTIEIVLDTDNDGSFGDDEMLVSDMPVRGVADWRSGYYATGDGIEDGVAAQVTIDGEVHMATVATKTFEVGDLLDLASVTDPENAMKGWGGSVAHAATESISLSNEGVPDLNQRKGECAPTAAANSLISLVDRYGGEDLVPGDPQDFIENLKRHMNWTPENGVPPDDFVEGKNRWAAAAGVPIRTSKVGDTHGLTTIDAIRRGLEDGGAVELRIKFADSAGTKIVGGHLVTVTGIHQQDGQTYLEINDPATPDSGTEMVEVRQNQITNYGPWEGVTILSWGFVQIWEGHPTGELLDTMTDEEIEGIRQFAGETPMLTIIEYNGKYLPTSQLKVESEEGCGEDHWHAARGGVVTATDGTIVPDPGPQCGYGKLSEKPSQNIPAPERNIRSADEHIEVRGLESLKTH